MGPGPLGPSHTPADLVEHILHKFLLQSLLQLTTWSQLGSPGSDLGPSGEYERLHWPVLIGILRCSSGIERVGSGLGYSIGEHAMATKGPWYGPQELESS